MTSCSLSAFLRGYRKQNSAIVHAVSSTPGKGAFKRVGLAIPFATNPAVHWDAKAKLWRMLVIKTGGPASKQVGFR